MIRSEDFLQPAQLASFSPKILKVYYENCKPIDKLATSNQFCISRLTEQIISATSDSRPCN